MAERPRRRTWDEELARGIALTEEGRARRKRLLTRPELFQARVLMLLSFPILFLVFVTSQSMIVGLAVAVASTLIGIVFMPAQHRRQIFGWRPRPGEDE